MTTRTHRQPAGRRVPRPPRVAPCTRCGAVRGFNYRSCAACYAAIEDLWEADWAALLAQEQIDSGSADEALLARIVLLEWDDHSWTIVDMAMCRVRCDECGDELGGGPVHCSPCAWAFGNLWWHDIDAARQGVMTANEHALRVGRYMIRHPHRYSAAIATGWRMNMPRMLVGWLPRGEDARHGATLLKRGQAVDWDAVYHTIDEEINQGAG